MTPTAKQRNGIISSISVTIIANIICTAVSIAVSLFLPKYVGVDTYGYWQMYTMYIGYVGLLQLGLNEGTYLQLGGKRITELREYHIRDQVKLLVCAQALISIILLMFAISNNGDTRLIFIVICAMIIPCNLQNYCTYMLMATNEISSYAKAIVIDRAAFFTVLVSLMLFGHRTIETLILSDCVGRLLSCLYSFVVVQKYTRNQSRASMKWSIREALLNIKFGSQLLLANLTGGMSVSVVRVVVSAYWSIETFSHISFSVLITNTIMTLINSIGIALFPILKRIDAEKSKKLYASLRTILSNVMMCGIVLYFPMRTILTKWLPNYEISIIYAGMLLPIVIFESKTAILLNTYYKALRKETKLLIMNVLTVVISIALTFISVAWLNNKILAVFVILIVMIFRSVAMEAQLARYIDIQWKMNTIVEILLATVFVVSTSLLDTVTGVATYCLALISVLLANRKRIRAAATALLSATRNG